MPEWADSICFLAIELISIHERICFNVCFIQQDTIEFLHEQ